MNMVRWNADSRTKCCVFKCKSINLCTTERANYLKLETRACIRLCRLLSTVLWWRKNLKRAFLRSAAYVLVKPSSNKTPLKVSYKSGVSCWKLKKMLIWAINLMNKTQMRSLEIFQYLLTNFIFWNHLLDSCIIWKF